MVSHPVFVPSVHKRIKKLTDLLVAECKQRGYAFDHPGCWGYGCRATKGSTGDTPSFHSWGLALDFNAPENVFGGAASESDINVNNHWIVPLMKAYGFFWLGPPIGDWMHFSFCGSPADADKMLRKAKRNGLGQPPPPAYAVGTKTFRVLRNAVAFLRDKLRHAKPGTRLRLRVVRRK